MIVSVPFMTHKNYFLFFILFLDSDDVVSALQNVMRFEDLQERNRGTQMNMYIEGKEE